MQWSQPSFRFLSLYDWQNRESFLQRLWTLVPGHLSSHSALSSYGLFAPLTLWRLSVSLRPLILTLGSWPTSELCTVIESQPSAAWWGEKARCLTPERRVDAIE